LDFVGRGGNLVISASPESKRPIRSLSAELGFVMLPAGSAVVDHVWFDSKLDQSGKHTTIIADDLGDHPAVLGRGKKPSSVLFRGIGHELHGENPLVFSLVSANPSSISWDASKAKSGPSSVTFRGTSGRDIALISASQTRNNARVLFTGSMEVFSNEFLRAELTATVDSGDDKAPLLGVSGNKILITNLLQWVFQEKSVLRLKRSFHHRKGEDKPRTWYRIKDEFVYGVEVEEYHAVGKWAPFMIPPGDVMQFTSTLLHPYIRVNMISGKQAGTYVTPSDLRLPDKHGVFTHKVEYNRRGYSYLESKVVAASQPFRHNEVPRFIPAMYPYYANMFSMMGGFLLVSAVFLFYQHGAKPSSADSKVKTS
jgi:oligosaccharyltransferase complex subunit beta